MFLSANSASLVRGSKTLGKQQQDHKAGRQVLAPGRLSQTTCVISTILWLPLLKNTFIIIREIKPCISQRVQSIFNLTHQQAYLLARPTGRSKKPSSNL